LRVNGIVDAQRYVNSQATAEGNRHARRGDVVFLQNVPGLGNRVFGIWNRQEVEMDKRHHPTPLHLVFDPAIGNPSVTSCHDDAMNVTALSYRDSGSCSWAHGTSIDIPNFGPRRVREAPFVGLGSQEFDACGISIDVERQKRRGRRLRGT